MEAKPRRAEAERGWGWEWGENHLMPSPQAAYFSLIRMRCMISLCGWWWQERNRGWSRQVPSGSSPSPQAPSVGVLCDAFVI
jgi:hypothetical protein